MSSQNLDQSQTPTTETWIRESGLNPRTDWDIDWQERLEDGPVAVYFEPFHGLYPVYCECSDVYEGFAVLKVPPKKKEGRHWTNWFPEWLPEDEWSCAIVPEIFVRLQ